MSSPNRFTARILSGLPTGPTGIGKTKSDIPVGFPSRQLLLVWHLACGSAGKGLPDQLRSRAHDTSAVQLRAPSSGPEMTAPTLNRIGSWRPDTRRIQELPFQFDLVATGFRPFDS